MCFVWIQHRVKCHLREYKRCRITFLTCFSVYDFSMISGHRKKHFGFRELIFYERVLLKMLREVNYLQVLVGSSLFTFVNGILMRCVPKLHFVGDRRICFLSRSLNFFLWLQDWNILFFLVYVWNTVGFSWVTEKKVRPRITGETLDWIFKTQIRSRVVVSKPRNDDIHTPTVQKCLLLAAAYGSYISTTYRLFL